MQVAASVPAAAFLGWRIVLVGFVANFLNTACTFGAFGVFVIPLAEEFGADRGDISAAPGIAMFIGAPLGLVIGHLADRGPVRLVMLIGLAATSAGLLLMARAESLFWIGALFCGLVFHAANFCGPMTAMALVGRWFARKRGLAIGLSVAGSTIATAAAPYAAARLVSELGWRGAVDVFSIAALVIGLPIFAAFVIRSPEEVGQHPDGAAEAPLEVAASALPGEGGGLLREPNFYLLGIGFALLFSSPIVNASHFVPFAQDLGLSATQAALPLSVLAVCSLIGKLVFGVIGDRIDPRRAALIAVSLGVAAWATLATEPDMRGLVAAGALMGFGVGAVAPLHGVLVGRCFGRAAIGKIVGAGGLLGLPIIAGSGIVAGKLYDRTGSYELPFAIEAMALALAGLLILLLRLPPLSATASEAEASPLRSPA